MYITLLASSAAGCFVVLSVTSSTPMKSPIPLKKKKQKKKQQQQVKMKRSNLHTDHNLGLTLLRKSVHIQMRTSFLETLLLDMKMTLPLLPWQGLCILLLIWMRS